MAKAIWNGVIIAQSDRFEVVENNVYFPSDSVNQEFLISSDHSSHCPWKGDAQYFTIAVNGQQNPDAAWYYPAPFEKAKNLKDHIAFWKGVTVER